MSNPDEKQGTMSALTSAAGKYLRLLVEDTRLNVAEKLTQLMSAVALTAIALFIGTVALVFVSIAIGIALAGAINPLWAFIIVAAFYIILLVVIFAFRTTLLVNPIARFISRLVLPAPKKESHNDQSASVS